jgi:hypothetical protein
MIWQWEDERRRRERKEYSTNKKEPAKERESEQ